MEIVVSLSVFEDLSVQTGVFLRVRSLQKTLRPEMSKKPMQKWPLTGARSNTTGFPLVFHISACQCMTFVLASRML